ncbi:MAG: hypothetical protein AUJ98_07250 [Bacteroidetes bacterium CG2_30_33_31]|nr:MAG: hypothetical protein AUJ98_07250 [Bacteroidetes bacterium CG2_30_33_31]
MKRIFISAIVASIIFFAYQSLSWTLLPTHSNSVKYTNNQDTILHTLNKNLSEDGFYYVPSQKNGETMEEFNKNAEGKPFAIINYHKSLTNNMAVGMTLGFIFNFMGLLMASIILFNLKTNLRFVSRWFLVMSIASIIFFMSLMTSWNWWHTPSHFLKGEIFDIIIGWGITGIWLAWYSGRKSII